MRASSFGRSAACALVLLAAAASAQAQVACGVGTRVEFEEGRGGIGTIAEIGTTAPHVGWYRIVQSWSPSGEWYQPQTWKVFRAGTTERCYVTVPGAAAAPPAARPAPAAPAPQAAPGQPNVAAATPAPAAGGGTADCPFNEPPGPANNSMPASAQLFQRVIWEYAAARVNPASVSAPKRVGISFLQFEVGQPFQNTLTANRFGDKRLHTGAPVNEMVYPVRTRELQCDLHGAEVRRTVSDVDRSCFKGRSGNWTCPGRTVKTVESRLIPVK